MIANGSFAGERLMRRTAILRIDDELLALGIGISGLGIDVLVDGSGADATEQAGVLADVGRCVCSLGARRLGQAQMDRLILGVIGVGKRDRGEDVER